MARDATGARAHLVLVPNPPYHPGGDFALVDGLVALERQPAAHVREHRPLRHRRSSTNFRGDEAQTAALPPTVDSRRSRFRRDFRRRHGRTSARRTISRSSTLRCEGESRSARRFDACAPADGRRAERIHRPEHLDVPHGHRRTADNPLLEFRGLPRFDAIRPAHVAPAVDALAPRRRAPRWSGSPTDTRPATWDIVAEPLVEPLDRLDRVWGAAAPSQRGRQHARMARCLSREPSQDHRVLHRPRAGSAPLRALPRARRRAVVRDARRARSGGPWTNELRDFRLGGAELPAPQKARLKAVEEELASLAAKFDDNLLDATNAWALYVTDPRELAGIPDSVLADARAAARSRRPGRAGSSRCTCRACWPVMSYADNRALRATLHRAYATRASDLGASPAWDNGPAIRRLLLLRREAAQLLGYPNFAALSLVPKMAKSVDEVLAFLRDLARRAQALRRARRRRAPAFAAAELGLPDLAPWDRAYASEKLKAQKFAFSEQQVRRYFPEDKVLEGLFRVTETLYGISIRAERGRDVAPRRPVLRRRRRLRRTDRPVLSRQLRAPRQAGRRLAGRRHQPPPRRRARPASGRLSHVQPVGARPAASPRRSRTTKSSRSSTSSATACTSC